jgi:quercetin dioxygenase-like cupin family protein
MKNKLSYLAILIFLFPLYNSAKDTLYNPSVSSTIILKTDTTTIGQKLVDLFPKNPEVTGLKVIIPPQSETGWHKHTVPGFAYIVRGSLAVEIDSGKSLQFTAGQSFAEVVNVFHNGKNNGKDTVELVAFFMGQKGVGITIKK